MAALTVQTITAAGITPATAVQITAYSGTGDTIASGDIGNRGVWAEVSNTSGSTKAFQVQDPGRTPAGNAAANGFASVSVPTGSSRLVYIGPKNVDPTTGTVKVGSDQTAVSTFTVRVFRY